MEPNKLSRQGATRVRHPIYATWPLVRCVGLVLSGLAEIDVGRHPWLPPPLNCKAADKTESEPGRSDNTLDLDGRSEDVVHRR